jgi:hypothetical protein
MAESRWAVVSRLARSKRELERGMLLAKGGLKLKGCVTCCGVVEQSEESPPRQR